MQACAAIYMCKKYLNVNTQTSFDFGTILTDLNVKYSLEEIKSCAKCFNQLANLI